jgi:hypothetical protein
MASGNATIALHKGVNTRRSGIYSVYCRSSYNVRALFVYNTRTCRIDVHRILARPCSAFPLVYVPQVCFDKVWFSNAAEQLDGSSNSMM